MLSAFRPILARTSTFTNRKSPIPPIHVAHSHQDHQSPSYFTPADMVDHLKALNLEGIKVTEDAAGKTIIDIEIPARLQGLNSDRVHNLVDIIDGYFNQSGMHININVFNRETLQDAMEHPERYPNLAIRVSGYAVNWNRLTREQQLEVIARTIHEMR